MSMLHGSNVTEWGHSPEKPNGINLAFPVNYSWDVLEPLLLACSYLRLPEVFTAVSVVHS